MRIHVLSSLLSLLTVVWAGGYQGCLERVFMYQAYLIDGINPPNDQIMGWQCIGRNFNAGTRTCLPGGWVRTPGYAPNSRISYDKFIYSLSTKTTRGRLWSVTGPDGSLDIEKTAKKTYDEYSKPVPGGNPANAFPRNFGANTFMKETVEWNDCIKKASKMVERTYRMNKATLTDKQKKLFRDYDTTRDLVLMARIGDHGGFLIADAKKQLDPKGIDIVTKKIGTNPIPDGSVWVTVDWKETIKKAEDAGKANAKKEVQAVAKQIYMARPRNDARLHKQVMDSYRQAQDRKPNCGRV
ncbi:hypothetical protein J1614_006769 [Plenodomus biglobosus]|nr:hypothetical protein J1614_006769 [Plenodomus biglobosus]